MDTDVEVGRLRRTVEGERRVEKTEMMEHTQMHISWTALHALDETWQYGEMYTSRTSRLGLFNYCVTDARSSPTDAAVASHRSPPKTLWSLRYSYIYLLTTLYCS